MIEAEHNWFGLPLELLHSRVEAEQRYQYWQERAKQLTAAEVRVSAWRAPDGSEVFVLSTRNRELTRMRTDWDRAANELLDDPKLGRFRHMEFALRPWRNQFALVRKDRRLLKQAQTDAEYDPEEWDLVPEGWDHDHCGLCWAHICSHADHGFTEAYFALLGAEGYGAWICPPCYEQRIAGWSRIPI